VREIRFIFNPGSSAGGPVIHRRYNLSYGIGTKDSLGGGSLRGGSTILARMQMLPTTNEQVIQAPMGVWRHQQAISNLEARLVRQETLCNDLKREQRKLDLEFTELFDKVSRQMGRMARRFGHDKKNNEELLEPEEADDGLDPISRSILQRRGARRVNP